MKLYDKNQNVTIDEDAANRDIRRINQALPSLHDAKTSLERVREEGNRTQGETGRAIVEKSTELIRRIDRLISSLEETKVFLKRTVVKYQEIDENLAKAAQSFVGAWRM